MPDSYKILEVKYDQLECIKKDNHSAVYSGYNKKKKRKEIIKVLDKENIPDSSILERFKREAKVLSGLEHPNINNVHDYWSDEKNFFISFEYFESSNLRHFIRNKKLSVDDKRKLVKQLFSGIHYAHSKGIIHRDIKPENILVSNNLTLKIVDFGLAFGLNDSLVTAQYSLVGTPSYMSPEQIQGDRPSFKSDLFSAGIVVYELYTGVNPFLGQDINDTLNKVLSYDEEKHLPLLSSLPEDISHAVKCLLKKESTERIESAFDLLKLLKEEANQGKAKSRKIIYLIPAAALLLLTILFIVNKQNEVQALSQDKLNQAVQPFSSGEVITLAKEPYQKTIKKETELKDQVLPELKKEGNPPEKKLISENITPAVIRKGTLYIECIPWAYVYIDLDKSEITPLKSGIILNEGSHNVKLVHPNYPSFNRTIRITGNEETRLKVNLDTLFGYLDCKVSPWGELYINNTFKGETPLQRPIKLTPGEYRVLLKNKLYETAEYDVLISQNATFTLKHVFKKKEN